MSSLTRPPAIVAYGGAAVLALLELVVFWQALHPQVPESYNAYYIAQSTTCLDQPVAGDYVLGTRQSFRSGSEDAIKPIRVCGWEGPAGNGLHAVGESSRLRFALPENPGALSLELELAAVDQSGSKGQLVQVLANDVLVKELRVKTGNPQQFRVTVPADVTAGKAALDVELAYPEAISTEPQQSNTRKRSIMFSEARLSRLATSLAPQPI